ncbi:DUF3667 domain-containing protein [Daejeonella lutea]|uniref:Uncharacterized protein n=1 Tax=Daejeonella lutea TaxID=572036 RepID=A0A1T5DBG9_9SPHI|nr:DUF3667 domain-containing protein [Daejeonella lutea]SKB68956.1 Protein of unknown function [Daejeonella lutea]
MKICTNCGNPIAEKYCPNCGQSAQIKRIDGHYIIHEIEHVLHLEKGILFTFRELMIRPGKNVREFISGSRSRLVKPIIFIIVTSLLYSLANHFFHVEDGYMNIGEDKRGTTTAIFEWIQKHYGYGNIMMGVFIALWLKFFFKKYDYNFFEILILLCFVMGMGMLVLALFATIEGVTKLPVMQIASVIIMFYVPWAIGQFFDKSKAASYFKAFAAYVLGMLSFAGLIILTGTLIDKVI